MKLLLLTFVFSQITLLPTAILNCSLLDQFSHRYRLAPENPYPAPLNDCVAVARYILENPQEYGIDGSRIALSGKTNRLPNLKGIQGTFLSKTNQNKTNKYKHFFQGYIPLQPKILASWVGVGQ